MDKSSYFEILGNFGVPKYTLNVYLNVIFPSLKCSSLKHLWDIMCVEKIIKILVREVIAEIVVKKKCGSKTYLLKYEESYIVAISEIDGSLVLLRDIYTFTNELQQLIHDVGQRIISNASKP